MQRLLICFLFFLRASTFKFIASMELEWSMLNFLKTLELFLCFPRFKSVELLPGEQLAILWSLLVKILVHFLASFFFFRKMMLVDLPEECRGMSVEIECFLEVKWEGIWGHIWIMNGFY